MDTERETATLLDEARSLVEQLAHSETRWPAWKRLEQIGSAAAPAVREGLRHGHWQVRKWCAGFLDHHADPESIPELLPLLNDPKSDVRLFAVHSLSCDRCKVGENPVDFVPHLIDRIERDESIRVRRMALVMLTIHPDLRCARLFARVLAEETDAKLRLHAEWGMKRCREAGLVTGTSR